MTSRLTVSVALSLTLAGSLCDSAVAQQPPKAASNDFVVLPLKHTDAVSIATTLQEAFGGQKQAVVRIIADVRTNALLVSAPEAQVTNLRDLIAKLDVPGRDAGDTSRYSLHVFALKHVIPDKSLENSLKLAMSGSPNSRVSLDPVRRQVLAYADEATHKTLAALLARLDEAPAAAPVGDVQVRVVWLVSGASADSSQLPPPDDLKDVLPGLAKLGIDKPRLAAQTLVNVTPNSTFQASGLARLDGPCQFNVTGMLASKPDAAGLQIGIKATRTTAKGNIDIGNIQTEINAPLGHFVVLGVTPTDAATSVFVVQVLGQGAKPRK